MVTPNDKPNSGFGATPKDSFNDSKLLPKFRFGVQANHVHSRHEWVELARKVEDRGYSTLTMPDHFDTQLAPIVALMAAADATEVLRVGTLVACNDYRHPTVLAKEAATVDLLSDGRLELGVGAGWMDVDYEATGIPFDRPGVRIERMAEAVEIIKGCFSETPVNFTGEHYTIKEYDAYPKPVQQPHPPLLIGGGGPRFLKLAGKLATIVGVNPNLSAGLINAETARDATVERYRQKLGWVKEGAGGRFDDIELQLRVFVVAVTGNRRKTAETIVEPMGFTITEGFDCPLALVGTVDQIVEDLQLRREELGFSYIVVSADEFEQFAPVVHKLAGI